MALPRRVQAVVFDMDGLLVDTEVLIRDLMMALAPEFGAHLPHDVFQRMVGLPNDASDAVAKGHFGPDFPFEAWDQELNRRIHAAIDVGVTLKAGVVEILDHLDGAGLPRA